MTSSVCVFRIIKTYKMLLLLSFCELLVISNAGYADPMLPNMVNKLSGSNDSFSYAFAGGWPRNYENAFAGEAAPVGDFLENLRKHQELFESSIINWASGIGGGNRQYPPVPEIPRKLGTDAEGAYAGAAIGPSGIYQTAQIFPENANSPNIETRFAASNPSPDGGNFYAVATSSQAGSQTVDGKTTGFRKAITTVNNNGNVTTYTAQDP